MRSLPNNVSRPSLLGTLYCDADHVTSLVDPTEKVMILNPCDGRGINIIDCHCDGIDEFIKDVGGLDMNTKTLSGRSPLINDDITVVPREWFDRPPDAIKGDIVGVRLGDILSSRARNRGGTLRLSNDVHIDLAALSRPVFQGKHVILFASGVDVEIEGLWWRRDPIKLFESIASANFYAVTGMNFSLFIHECPLAHLININKSLMFLDELSKLGVPIIPHVYAVNDNQRAKWVNFLASRPNIHTVVINTQMQRHPSAMREVELTVNELLKNTHVTVLLNGRRPKAAVYGQDWEERVFVANQCGLKKQAIIEKALLRNMNAYQPQVY